MIDNSKYILFTLLAYKLILILIGLWSRKKNNSVSDYFIASRRLGPWIAALSASASSSSAWTLLGVSGAAYLWGLPALWIFPATLSGFFINWLFIAPKLNQLSQKYQLLTLTEFLALGKNGTVKEIKYLASFIIVFCFIFYIASQFDAAGQSFESTFGLKKSESIMIGIAIILFYTLLGGFWAVSVSDSLQGIMMAISAIILPIVALSQAGLDQIFMDLSSQSLFSTPSGITGLAAFGFILGTMGIGIGYPGQPHVLNRLMAIETEKKIKQGRLIAIVWALIIYPGMILLGWAGRTLVSSAQNEQILILLGNDLLPPVLAGIVLASVLSAIMSTADSQLLVASSAICHDLSLSQKEFTLKETRIVVTAVCLIAGLTALFIDKSIYSQVLFAFSAMGSAFGPLVIGRIQGFVDNKYAFLSIFAGFSLTVMIHFSSFKSEGSPFERIFPFVVAYILVQLGRRKELS